jgi:hypothetical protein
MNCSTDPIANHRPIATSDVNTFALLGGDDSVRLRVRSVFEIGLEKRLESAFARGSGSAHRVRKSRRGSNSDKTDKQFLSTAHDRCFSLRVADREAEQPGSIPLAISYEQQLDVSSGSVRLNALWISGASARTWAILCAPTCFS